MAISETISVDAGPGIAGLEEFAAAAEAAAAKYDASMGKLKPPTMAGGAAGAGADKMAAAMDAAAAKISASVDKINAAIGKLGEGAAGAAAGLERLDGVAASAEKSLAGAAKGADAAAEANARLAETSDAAGAAMDKQAVAGARAGATAKESAGFFSRHKEAILGTALVLGYSVDKAMKFNAQMTLLTTQAGVSSKQLPELSRGVLQLAGQVGQSPGNLAESLYHVESNMSSLGIKAPQALHMVEVAAEGASVGHANLVDTTNALTAAVASGIPGVKSYDQAMGVLNATVGSGDMSMQDLTEAMGTGVLAVIKGYGANIKDAGAALAVFGDNNIRGAHSGTALRMAVQSLAVPAASAKKQLADLGLTTTTLADTMQKHGMLAALEQLDTAFKKHGVTAQNEGQVLTTLFGKKAGVGLAILMEQMGRLQSKYPELTAGANKFGEAWSKTADTAQQKLHNVEQGAQALAITAGNVLMPAASGILGGLNKAFNWIQGNAFASKGVALGAGGLVAGGLAKGLFSGVESGLSGLGKIGSLLRIPGADKLAGIGKTAGLDAAGGRLSAAGGELSAAAAELSGAAGKLGGEGALGGAAGKAEGAAAGAEGAAAGAGASRFKGAAVTAGLGVLATATIVDPWLKSLKNSQGNWLDNAFGTPKTSAWNSWGQLGHDISTQWGTSGRAPAAPAAIQQSGTSSAFAGRFGSTAGPVPVIKPKIAPPDSGALAGFSAALASAMHLKPAKMPPPDLSAMAAAKGSVAADAAAIAQAADNALKKPAKAAAPDLSAYAAAKGPAAADGAAVSAGFAAGIESGKGAAVAAAADVASAAAAAMGHAVQVRSPSKVTQKIGAQTAKGFEVGLQGGQAAINAAATALGKNVAKAADIATIDSTVAKLKAEVKGDTGLVRWLGKEQGKLTGLANQRAKLETEISDSEQVAKNAIGSASIMNALNAVNPAGALPIASSAIVTGQQYQASSMKQFASQLLQLQKMGLNATSLSQIAQAGPDQGLGIAQGITSGGKQAVTQLNQLQKQIHASAAQIGDVAGPAMYQSGKDIAAGLADGLKADLAGVDKAMQKLADQMVASVSKHAKTAKGKAARAAAGAAAGGGSAGFAASDGTGAAGSGTGGLGGAAAGLSAAGARLSAAAAALSSAAASLKKDAGGGGGSAAPGGGRPGGGYGGGGHFGTPAIGGGPHVVHHHYTTVNVQGNVHTENDLAAVLQERVLTRAAQNWQTGWRLPGHAA